MINHFHTLLLNKAPAFYTSSLFPIYVDANYIAYSNDKIRTKLDNILFGGASDPSLMDYRFLKFLRLIKSCDLYGHVLRFDPRETYVLDQYDLSDPSLFSTKVSDDNGIRFQTIEMYAENDAAFMRKLLHVSRKNSVIRVFDQGSEADIDYVDHGGGNILIPNLNIAISQIPEGTATEIDYRFYDTKQISEIVQETLSFTSNEYFDLFRPLREKFPEYEEGFRHVTDNIHRFCMLIFAKAAFGMFKQHHIA